MATATKKIVIPLNSDLGQRIIATKDFKVSYPDSVTSYNWNTGRYDKKSTPATQKKLNSFVNDTMSLSPYMKYTCSMKEVGRVDGDFAKKNVSLFVDMVRFAAEAAGGTDGGRGMVIYNSNTKLSCSAKGYIKHIHTYKGSYNSTVYVYAINVNQ